MTMKKKSTHCRDCGVEFAGTNKFNKRALCIECARIEVRNNTKRKPKEEYRHIKYEEFKIENRSDYYSAILAETKGMEREEHLVWIRNKFNEIMQNTKLWEYITTQDSYAKQKRNYQKRKLNSSKGLLENF